MDQYAGSPGRSVYCYTELATSFINFLHYCSPSSVFYGAGKDNRGRCTKNPSGCIHFRLSMPTPPSSPYFTLNVLSAATLPIFPVLRQALNIAALHYPLAWFWQSVILVYFELQSVVCIHVCCV